MGRKSREKKERRVREAQAQAPMQPTASTAAVTDALAKSRNQYANRWTASAKAHAQQGDYTWLAQHLEGHRLILDIGTGDGHGIVELLRRGHLVVSIDENPECLKSAQRLLSTENYRVQVITRGQPIGLGNGQHRIAYGPLVAQIPSEGAMLIEADLLSDSYFKTWVMNTTFDAVTCWLVGTHATRLNNASLSELTRESVGMYRLTVQQAAYDIADKVLRPGGVLQVVYRGEYPHEQCIVNDEWRSNREQASGTALIVESIHYRKLDPEAMQAGIRMVPTVGLSGRIPDHSDIAIASVLSRKPITKWHEISPYPA